LPTFKSGAFAAQNGSYRTLKWAVFTVQMGHIATERNWNRKIKDLMKYGKNIKVYKK